MWRVIVLIPCLVLSWKSVEWAQAAFRQSKDPAFLYYSSERDRKGIKRMVWLFGLCALLYLTVALMCVHGLLA